MLKPLQIPSKRKYPGLKIWCTKCHTLVNKTCKDSGKKMQSCEFGSEHSYKVIVYKNNQRKTHLLDTRDYDEALVQAIQFKKDVKDGLFDPESTDQTKETSPQKLIDCLAHYIGYISDDPEVIGTSEPKDLTKGHISDVGKCFESFITFLNEIGLGRDSLRFDEINRSIVEQYQGYLLKTKGLSNRTRNKYFGCLRGVYNYYIDYKEYNIRNPFKGFPDKPVYSEVPAISIKDFHRVINIIKQENGIETIPTTGEKKQLYRDWLIPAYLLSLQTGRRREEISRMKYSDIKESHNGELKSIRFEDYKVNRIKKREGQNKKFNYTPITQGLKALLMSVFNYPENKDSDKYLIGPDEKINRRVTMPNLLTRAFSHYYKQLDNPETDISFKSIRKRYITALASHIGVERARLIIGHSSGQVTANNYVDYRDVAATISEATQDFDPQNDERKAELEQTRSAIDRSDNQNSIER